MSRERSTITGPQQIDGEWTDTAAQDREAVGEQVEDVGLGGRRNRRHHRTERRQQVQLAPDEPPLQVERPAEVGLFVRRWRPTAQARARGATRISSGN